MICSPEQVGETMSTLELGLMLAECKKWGGDGSDMDQPTKVETIDLDDDESGVSRSEFKNMLT